MPKILFLNQVSGPLFRELAEDVADQLGSGELFTHRGYLPSGFSPARLEIVDAPAYDRRSLWRRLWSWTAYLCGALVHAVRSGREPCLFIVSNPPLLAWVGWWLNVVRGQRYVVLVYDVYPGLLENLGRIRRHGVVAGLWRWMNRVTWARADVIFTIGEHMAVNVRGMLPAQGPGPAVHVIPNWADGTFMRPRPKTENWFAQKLGLGDALCVLYSGNIGHTHDLGPLLEAARQLRDEPEIRFVIIGAGGRWAEIEAWVAREALTNVTLLPFQPEEHIPFTLAMADVGVVTLQAGVEGHSVPSKTYYLLAAGAALLAISRGRNELTEIVSRHGCGIAVPADDAAAVVAALQRFRREPEFLARCRLAARAAQEQFYARQNTAAYVQVLRQCGLAA